MVKESLRTELLARRRAHSADENAEYEHALAEHALSQHALARASRVAAYRAMPTEPATGALIDGLVARGCEVILPVTQPDGSLEWVAWHPGAVIHRTELGIEEPAGPPLGTHALDTCQVAVVPALAVDYQGYRLGRGGGYYDRALANTGTVTAALLFDDEIVSDVGRESHDIPVDLAICPSGVFRPEQSHANRGF